MVACGISIAPVCVSFYTPWGKSCIVSILHFMVSIMISQKITSARDAAASEYPFDAAVLFHFFPFSKRKVITLFLLGVSVRVFDL